MKLFYLLPLFLIAFLSTNAQSRYLVNATLVKKNGDTLTGYIERVRDNLLSQSVNFRSSATDKQSITFTPNDVRSFTLTDNNLNYESVTYHDTTNNKVINEDRFALLLLRGYYSLYFLELKSEEAKVILEQHSSHVFIAKKENVFTVLKQSESMNGSSYKLVESYIDTLKTLFKDCPAVANDKIKDTRFYKKSMVNIFGAYNACVKPDLPSIVFKASQKLEINTGAYIAYLLYKPKKDGSSSGISLGFSIDFTNAAVNERLSFSTGFNYSAINGTFNKVKGKQRLYGVPLKVTYWFGDGKVKPFVSAGLIPTVAKTDLANGTIYTDFLPSFSIFGTVGPGISFGKGYAAFYLDRGSFFSSGQNTYLNVRLGLML